ncbi:MAG: recombinase family protein [Eubacteriaceae bacterium]|nr:recombinase family protein [Eubacteriaceae bacterium]
MVVRIIEPRIKNFDKKKRACAYVRVSTEFEKQNESLENQTEYYETKIKANPNLEFVAIFSDRGISGTTKNRPEFQRMLEACRAGRIDLIYTKSISRLARNTLVMLEIIRELKDLGVGIMFERENINTLSGDGELMLTVLSSFAEEESRSTSENMKWGIRKRFEEGKLMINTTGFLGYDKDNEGNLVINEDQAVIVRRIFQDYLSGIGVHKIAKELNDTSVPTMRGGRWHKTTVLTILKNEKYKGDALLQKTFRKNHLSKCPTINRGEVDSFYIERNHPAIIEREFWEAVQLEIDLRGKARGLNNEDKEKYQNRYPLSGMLFCSKCGAYLRRVTSTNKKTYGRIEWTCSNYINNGKKACSGTVIYDTIVEGESIKEPTIIKEEYRNGKKHYIYTSKK